MRRARQRPPVAAGLAPLAFAYALASLGTANAARGVSRRLTSGPTRAAGVAYATWWTAGSVLCGMQCAEALLLLTGASSPGLALTLALARAFAVAVALAGLLYYLGFLAIGRASHAPLVALCAGALLGGLVEGALVVEPARLADERLLPLLLGGAAGAGGTAAELAVFFLSLVGMAAFGFVSMRAAEGARRWRGMLVGTGVCVAALAPLLAPTLAFDAALAEASGVSVASVLVLVAYGLREPARAESAADAGERARG